MKTQLITFDLDGTLFDTAPEIALAVNRALEAHGLPPVSLDTVIGYIGNGTRELMRQVLARHGFDAQITLDEMMPVFDAHYDATAGTTAKPYPGVPAALARLRAAGMRMAVVTNKDHRFAQRLIEAVVTNKDHRFAQRLIERAGFAQYFDVVLGGDSLPDKKPHPAPILYCMERLDVPMAAAAHLGDSRTDVQSARRAGVAAWAVPYGYNHGVPIAQAHPDRVFASIAEMADYVLPSSLSHMESELNTN